MARIAINGLGRIGRAALKIVLDTPGLELSALNDIASVDNLAYLLKYDTVYGRYERPVTADGDRLIIADREYTVFQKSDPSQLPWRELSIDLVLECSGVFTRRQDLEKHILAGAKVVILSAPSKSEDVVTIVHGVNKPDGPPNIIACASCTTNCIAPVMEIADRRVGVKKAIMTTVHAYTATQALVDSPDKHPRRGRAAAANFVPTSTGAAIATTKALPQLRGLFDGIAVRGPVAVGSVADIVLLTVRRTTVDELNRIFKEESKTERYEEVIGVAEDPIVSSDVIKDPRASIVDSSMTRVVDGDLVKILSWYDNEWGYACQMVREAVQMTRSAI